MYGKDIDRILISKEQIAERIKEVAREIGNDYKGKDVLFICVLRGAYIFFADLVREINEYDVNTFVDFIAVSSYGRGTTTSGEVRFVKDCTTPVAGRNIVLVEDIVDSGITLDYLKKVFISRNVESIKIATLLDKPSRRKVDLVPDYKLFEVPNEFVIGYGLDYDDKYRGLKDVCVLAPWVYEDNK